MLLFRKEYNKHKAVGEGVPTINQGSVRVDNEKDILDAAKLNTKGVVKISIRVKVV